MRCPTCGARMKKDAAICVKCGTRLEQIKKASHQAVSQARAEFEPEKVVLSTYFPTDLNYVKTLLLCIFLGLFGAHYFYVKRPIVGAIYAVCSGAFLLFYTITGAISMNQPDFYSTLPYGLNVLRFFVSIAGALIVLFWVSDIIKIAFKRFRVPVVLQDK